MSSSPKTVRKAFKSACKPGRPAHLSRTQGLAGTEGNKLVLSAQPGNAHRASRGAHESIFQSTLEDCSFSTFLVVLALLQLALGTFLTGGHRIGAKVKTQNMQSNRRNRACVDEQSERAWPLFRKCYCPLKQPAPLKSFKSNAELLDSSYLSAVNFALIFANLVIQILLIFLQF